MCMPKAPKAPPIPPAAPERQSARASPATQVRAASQDALRRRFGMAATVLTGPNGLAPPATTGKTLLGG